MNVSNLKLLSKWYKKQKIDVVKKQKMIWREINETMQDYIYYVRFM